MTHTLGPWVSQDDYIGTDGSDSQTVAYCSDHRNKRKRPAEETAANARLIAAAPDLLDACEAWMNWIKGSILSHDDIIKQTNAATTKARGQPPKKG